MKNIIVVVLMAWLCSGCEKVVDLDYKSNQSMIIIDGNIKNGIGPHFVRITKSITLTDTGYYPTIDDAIVSLRDDAGNSETLSAQGNGVYRSTAIEGIEGRRYTLTVLAENKEYTAESTMPQRVPLDSVKVEEIIFAGEPEYNLIPVYTDPIIKGNNYRFMVSVNDERIKQHFVQDDKVKNGVVNTFRLEVNDDEVALKKGDSVSVIMQCIDQNVALYYTTLALMGDSGPGGGTTPTNPPGNLSNGALGVFSAHVEETNSAVIK